MPPCGRNIAQGAQHKQPCMHPGVGKLGRTLFYPSIIIDEIEIKSPRGIEWPTPAAKLCLNFV